MKDITSFNFIEGVDSRVILGGYAVFLQKKHFIDFPNLPIYNIILSKVDEGVKEKRPEPLKFSYRGIFKMLTPAPSPFVLKISGYNQKYKYFIKGLNRRLNKYGLEGFTEGETVTDENGDKQQFYFLIRNDEEKERLFDFLNGR